MNAADLPVDWRRVERLRVEGDHGPETLWLMVTGESTLLVSGIALVRGRDGSLDFATVPGEDATSRILRIIDLGLIRKRTRMRQNLTHGSWEPAE